MAFTVFKNLFFNSAKAGLPALGRAAVIQGRNDALTADRLFFNDNGTWQAMLTESDVTFDVRDTSGGTRTETLNALAVGQTAIIIWTLYNNTGGGITITVALPAGGTYQMATHLGHNGLRNAMGGTSNNYVGGLGTLGIVAGGSSTTTVPATTNTATIFGFVKRIT